MDDRQLNDRGKIEAVFKALGAQLDREELPYDVEILVVGGVAGMIVGVVDPGRRTLDCDVLDYKPGDAFGTIEAAADVVRETHPDLNLAKGWLNSQVQIGLKCNMLPDGWERRRQLIGTWGRFTAFAAGRPDMIFMKVYAGREQDIADLIAAKVCTDEADSVRQHLGSLTEKGVSADKIQDAMELLNDLELDLL